MSKLFPSSPGNEYVGKLCKARIDIECMALSMARRPSWTSRSGLPAGVQGTGFGVLGLKFRVWGPQDLDLPFCCEDVTLRDLMRLQNT